MFVREWSKARVEMNCNTWSPNITMLSGFSLALKIDDGTDTAAARTNNHSLNSLPPQRTATATDESISVELLAPVAVTIVGAPYDAFKTDDDELVGEGEWLKTDDGGAVGAQPAPLGYFFRNITALNHSQPLHEASRWLDSVGGAGLVHYRLLPGHFPAGMGELSTPGHRSTTRWHGCCVRRRIWDPRSTSYPVVATQP